MRMAAWEGRAGTRRLRERLWMQELRSEGYGRNVQRRQSYGRRQRTCVLPLEMIRGRGEDRRLLRVGHGGGRGGGGGGGSG